MIIIFLNVFYCSIHYLGQTMNKYMSIDKCEKLVNFHHYCWWWNCNSINYRQYINVIWIYPLELWKKQSLYDYMPKTKWFPTSISWSQLLREIISCCCSYVFDMRRIICQYVYVYKIWPVSATSRHLIEYLHILLSM